MEKTKESVSNAKIMGTFTNYFLNCMPHRQPLLPLILRTNQLIKSNFLWLLTPLTPARKKLKN
ncbi:hypothetical protein [Vibrio alfacsensis]|uniref:hypothetical protein n=1 Tax=Vibrio TaxID=662 RepID=UPI004067ACA3